MSILHFVSGVAVGIIGFLIVHFVTNENYHEQPPPPPPPSGSAHSRRRRRRSSVERLGNDKPGDNCVICLNAMNVHNIRPLLCGHALHKICYDEAKANYVTTCPSCRQRM